MVPSLRDTAHYGGKPWQRENEGAGHMRPWEENGVAYVCSAPYLYFIRSIAPVTRIQDRFSPFGQAFLETDWTDDSMVKSTD